MTKPQPPARRSFRGALATMARADQVAMGFMALAIVLTVGALFGGPELGRSAGYVEAAPIIALGMILAMMGMFFDLVRHGIARAVLTACSVLLALFGVAFARHNPLFGVVFCYWLPAILAMGAVSILERGHRALSHPER